MIKLLKLQLPILLIIVGILAYIASVLLTAKIGRDYYLKELSGVLLIVGALWALYPILFAKKDNDGNVEIKTDPTVEVPAEPDAKPVEE